MKLKKPKSSLTPWDLSKDRVIAVGTIVGIQKDRKIVLFDHNAINDSSRRLIQHGFFDWSPVTRCRNVFAQLVDDDWAAAADLVYHFSVQGNQFVYHLVSFDNAIPLDPDAVDILERVIGYRSFGELTELASAQDESPFCSDQLFECIMRTLRLMEIQKRMKAA